MTSQICKNQLRSVFLLQGKIFALFLLLMSQYWFSQITLSEGATIYVNGDAIAVADSIPKKKSRNNEAKIFVSNGVKIANLGSENSFEIVELPNAQPQKPQHEKLVKLVAKQLKQKSDKQKRAQVICKVNKNYQILPQKSDTSFTLGSNSSKMFVLVSQHTAKHLVQNGAAHAFIQFGWHRLIVISYGEQNDISQVIANAFSIRPPPAAI